MRSVSCGLDNGIAFGIERNDGDRIPVTCVPRPSTWMDGFALDVQSMSGRQDVVIAPGMSLRRADVADGAVTVIVVVPTSPAFSSAGL